MTPFVTLPSGDVFKTEEIEGVRVKSPVSSANHPGATAKVDLLFRNKSFHSWYFPTEEEARAFGRAAGDAITAAMR